MGLFKQPESSSTEDRHTHTADELPSPTPHAGGVLSGGGQVREKWRPLVPEDPNSRKCTLPYLPTDQPGCILGEFFHPMPTVSDMV